MEKYKGIIYITLSAFFFALMNTFVKLSGDLPSIQKSFFRNLVACFFAYIMIKKAKEKVRFQKQNLPLLFLRASLGTIGILCNYYAVDRLMLSDASMLGKLAPFFVVLFSAIFLREKANWIQKSCVFIAFLGSLFIIKPSFDFQLMLPSVAGFIGAMAAGGAYTCVRGLTLRGEKGTSIILFFSAFSCLVTLPYLLFFYEPMNVQQFCFLMCAGFSAAAAQFAVTSAYAHAPAKEISVFDYSQVIFAAIMGLLLFGQIPDAYSFIGYAIIVGIGFVMFIENKKKKA